MLTGLTLWGSSQPRFKLDTDELGGRGLRETADRPAERLPGTFLVTNGLGTVTASEAMDEYLRNGDPISFDGGTKYYNISTVSGVNIVLAVTFAEGTDVTSAGYIDGSDIWMPFTTSTGFRFSEERHDGGATMIRLSDGTEIKRATGFRVEIGFRWDYLDRFSYAKMMLVHGFGLSGAIRVTPHDDVRWQLDMNLVSSIENEWPEGKLVGHAHSVMFRSVELVTDVPRVHNALTRSGFRPMIG